MIQKGDLVEYSGFRAGAAPEMGIVLDVNPRPALSWRARVPPIVVIYWINEATMAKLHRRVPAQFLKRLA